MQKNEVFNSQNVNKEFAQLYPNNGNQKFTNYELNTLKSNSNRLSRQYDRHMKHNTNQNAGQNKVSNVNNLTVDDCFNFMELYFDREGILYSHLYNSFNKFLDEDIKNFFENGDHTFYEKIVKDKIYKNKFKYESIMVKPPVLDNDVEPMFPSTARNRNLNYSGKIVAKVTQIQEVIDINTDEKTVKTIGVPEDNVPVAIIPIMVKSQYCNLNLYKNHDKSESEYDPGGYFIIKGSEKVIVSQDKMCENKPLVFIKKDSGNDVYAVQVNSKSYKPHGLTQVISIKMKKDNILTISVPILNEVPVFILIKALGIESDKDIISYIVYDENDYDMIDLLRISLNETKNEKNVRIQTQNDAIEFLTTKMRVVKKYSETDKNIRQQQKRLHLISLLQNGFLPHVDSDLKGKAIYLGLMINRLLRCYLKRIPKDDRDSYVNKRVDLPGNLIEELFKQLYRKMINECNKFFKKRNQHDNDPINIINQIKPNIIEQGLQTALATGSWIRRKGVAQMLPRLTYLQTISFLRRIDAPGGDASTNKLTGPRHLHPSSIRWLCCVTGDTEILMGDNASVMKFKDVKDGMEVKSVWKKKEKYKESVDGVTKDLEKDVFNECVSEVTKYFKKEKQPILKITTITGREIKCTYDHKLLGNQDGNCDYIEAQKLKIGDKLVVRHMQKYLSIEEKTICVSLKSENVNTMYLKKLSDKGLINVNFSQEQLEIIARLIGLSITDGNIGIRKGKNGNIRYYSNFIVGENEDAIDLDNDIRKLGFKKPTTRVRKSSFYNKEEYLCNCSVINVYNYGSFSYFLAEMGAFVGKKTEMHKKIPEWILKSNSRIKREFLSGIIGGDGCKICMHSGNNAVKMSSFGQTTYKDYEKSTLEYLESLCKLFKEFDIVCEVSKSRYVGDKFQKDYKKLPHNKNDDDEARRYFINFSESYENVVKFTDVIGFRYCNQRRRLSASIIEYAKYKINVLNKKQNERDEEYKIIKEEINKGKKSRQISDDTEIPYQTIRSLHYNITHGKVLETRLFSSDALSYEDFNKKYFVNDDLILSEINSIEKLPDEDVYDFETSTEAHSFIVNGIVSSNCVLNGVCAQNRKKSARKGGKHNYKCLRMN
jgi:DNA-directed RNA polymerase, beta subunit/140 kD subunit